MLTQSVHVLLLFLLYACMAGACAWAWRASPAFGAIVATGTAIRLVGGVGLVAISYYHWPMLQSLQTGDGYWAIAPDARVYFQLAADAARLPPGSIIAGSPSPTYVLALSLWFRAFGATVTNGVVFNVACYVVAAMAIIRLAGKGRRRLGAIALGCVSFSPALVLTSTQVLKDAFFATLIVVGCVAAVVILRYASESLSEGGGRLATAVGTACAAIAAMAGVRAYYAVFVWLAIAGGFFAAVWAAERRRRLGVSAFAAAMLVVLWCSFAVGADAYYLYYQELIARTTGINLSMAPLLPSGATVPSAPAAAGALGERLNALRDGFLGSGGATNFGRPHGPGRSVREIARDLFSGLAVTLVPITALKVAGVVSFTGGRGLLALTDLDTLFLTGSLIVICATMARSGGASRRNFASIVFLAALAIVSMLVVAYIVTNFGTLFRLRLLIAAPAWLAPAALSASFRST